MRPKQIADMLDKVGYESSTELDRLLNGNGHDLDRIGKGLSLPRGTEKRVTGLWPEPDDEYRERLIDEYVLRMKARADMMSITTIASGSGWQLQKVERIVGSVEVHCMRLTVNEIGTNKTAFIDLDNASALAVAALLNQFAEPRR